MSATILRTCTFSLTLALSLALAGCSGQQADAPSTGATTPAAAPEASTADDTAADHTVADDPTADDEASEGTTTDEGSAAGAGATGEDDGTAEDEGQGDDDDQGADEGQGADDPAEGEHDDSGTGPTTPPPGTTDVRVEVVYGSDGYPLATWSIDDLTDASPIGCWATSGSVNGETGYVCGSSADRGLACLANPLAADEVICITDPIAHEGYRRKVAGALPDLGTAEQMLPLTVELTDGSLWSLRSGGAAVSSPDGLVPFYWCESGCEGDALWGPAGEEAIDTSAPSWTTRRATENGTEDTYEVEIARVWFVAGG